uniref:MAGE domain-containing protein n=1 Tax=Gopherus agassizii TaxID=38772 RepID=A0A452HZ82_9SAUR
MATCLLLCYSWKTAFVIAITSVRRVLELRALTSDPQYTMFQKDKLQLRPHPAFLPKVVSAFHVNQDIFLLVFYPKPHTSRQEQQLHFLDVRRALTFYIERTTPFRRTSVDQKGFGLQLVEIDSKHHIYILVSNLPRLEVENLKQDDCTANLGLLTVILSFLFVKGNAAKESAVWELLRRLQVDPGVKHEVFGAVKKLVTEEFVRQKYLEYNRIPHTDPPEFEFQWGAWAAKETSKMQILRFVYTEAAAEEAAVGGPSPRGVMATCLMPPD